MRKTDLLAHARNSIFEIADQLEITTSCAGYQIADQIHQTLDAHCYYAPEVIYYADAWDVVNNSEYNDFEVYPDFSGCAHAVDYVMREAEAIIYQAYASELEQAICEFTEVIADLVDTLEIEFDLYACENLTISKSSLFGWAAHNRETETGIAIYDDAPGFYNAEKIEGELYAIETEVNGLFVSACWNPSKEKDAA